MWLSGPDSALLRLTRGAEVWEVRISLFPAQAYPEPSAPFWHCIAEFGPVDPWRYQIRGVMDGGDLVLTFDDAYPQRYTGPWAHLDERGQVVEPSKKSA